MGLTWKVASRYFEDRYARLLIAMSVGEAVAILGFPPGSTPEPSEVSKAWRAKAFENHPDRGGDPAKMVDINVAKDILLGNRRPDRGPPAPGARPNWRPKPQPEPPRERPKPPPPPPPPEGLSFNQVMSKMPGGVDWKFVSDSAYSQKLKEYTPEGFAATQRYWQHYFGYVLYGQTKDNHVFAGIRVATNGPTYTIFENGVWDGFYTSARRQLNLIRLAPKMVKGIMGGLDGMGDARTPKKYAVLDGTLTLADLKKRADLSLKDAIIGSGAMPEGAAGLKGRKKVVTIEPKFNRERFKEIRKQEGKVMMADWRPYTWTVEVNGKGRTLDEDELKRLAKNVFFFAVYKYDYDKGGKKNLTRLRGGRFGAGSAEALQLMYEALHGGPLKDQVKEAWEQVMAARKTACELAAEMPLQHVALLLDEPLLDVYGVVNV